MRHCLWFSGCVQQIFTRITHAHAHACPLQNSFVSTVEDLVMHCHINDPRGHFSSTPLPISSDTPLLCKEKSIIRIKPSLTSVRKKQCDCQSFNIGRDKAVRRQRLSSRWSICPQINTMLVISIFLLIIIQFCSTCGGFATASVWPRLQRSRPLNFNGRAVQLSLANNQHLSRTGRSQ